MRLCKQSLRTMGLGVQGLGFCFQKVYGGRVTSGLLRRGFSQELLGGGVLVRKKSWTYWKAQ